MSEPTYIIRGVAVPIRVLERDVGLDWMSLPMTRLGDRLREHGYAVNDSDDVDAVLMDLRDGALPRLSEKEPEG